MSIEKEDLTIIDPAALAPAATEAKAETVGVTKADMHPVKCFVSAMLAGAFIGFGAMYFCTFLGDTSMAFGVQRIVGGLCFCLGLCLVLCCGAELFTGNVLMACAKASGKISFGDMFRNWIIVWIGNLAGALVAVFIVFMSNLQGMNGGEVGNAFVCNILVCLAVWIGFSAKTVSDKIVGILLPISAFVACGFEHCVANMFFLPMGFILNGAGFGAVDAVTLAGIGYNLALATLGNIVGGLLVGMAYWFIYHKKQAK